jgi:hypothetical protein
MLDGTVGEAIVDARRKHPDCRKLRKPKDSPMCQKDRQHCQHCQPTIAGPKKRFWTAGNPDWFIEVHTGCGLEKIWRHDRIRASFFAREQLIAFSRAPPTAANF